MENHQGTAAHSANNRDLLNLAAPEDDVLQRRIDDLGDRTLAFVRARPGTCLVGALALGFIVGKVAARY